MRVIHLIYSLDPEHGGMSSAVRTLAEGCQAAGIESPVVSLDSPAMPWLKDWSTVVIATGPGRTRFGWAPGLAKALSREVPRAHAVVVHGLWQYHNVAGYRACRAAGVPCLVYPHGMLDPWALRQTPAKRLTKLLAWPVVTAPLLRHAARLCFTCEGELTAATPALQSIPFTPAILPLGVEPPPDKVEILRDEFHGREPRLRDRKVLLFLGRLHPKKGCDILIEGFARWRQTFASIDRFPIQLRIVGPPESPEYLGTLKNQCESYGLVVGEDVTFTGMVSGRSKWQELAGADALILPSHQENFGIVIGEALACGRPVLISNRVNIWPQIAQADAGFVAPDTTDGVVTLLSQWSALTEDEALAQSINASALYARDFSIPGRTAEFATLIQSLQTP